MVAVSNALPASDDTPFANASVCLALGSGIDPAAPPQASFVGRFQEARVWFTALPVDRLRRMLHRRASHGVLGAGGGMHANAVPSQLAVHIPCGGRLAGAVDSASITVVGSYPTSDVGVTLAPDWEPALLPRLVRSTCSGDSCTTETVWAPGASSDRASPWVHLVVLGPPPVGSAGWDAALRQVCDDATTFHAVTVVHGNHVSDADRGMWACPAWRVQHVRSDAVPADWVLVCCAACWFLAALGAHTPCSCCGVSAPPSRCGSRRVHRGAGCHGNAVSCSPWRPHPSSRASALGSVDRDVGCWWTRCGRWCGACR